MKKFTNIETDLVYENLDILEKFNNYSSNITEKLDKIKSNVEKLKETQQNEPNNWGYVGSIAKIDSDLDGILEFLNNKK